MNEPSDMSRVELQNLVGIQKEMLDEHRRLRYLTAWLIVLTLMLLSITVVTAAYTL